MVIAGVDCSITSPSVVVFELNGDFEIIAKNFFAVSRTKKDSSDSISWIKNKDFEYNFQKSIHIRNLIIDFLEYSKIDYVSFEGYSYGSVGRVFDIAEATSLLKSLFVERYDSKVRIYDPKSIKKFATGNGNADKNLMLRFYDTNGDKINLNDYGACYVNDVVDAFYSAKLLLQELRLRFGLDDIRAIDQNIRDVFNRVTKRQPENLLVTPFLEKMKRD